jgi:serine/threonine protein kinase
VKKLRNDGLLSCSETETNERTIHLRPWEQAPEAEDALTEIGILQYLTEQNDLSVHLLRMLAVYADDGYTWLVTELAEGGELFAVAASELLTEVRVQSYMMQLLDAADYLHDHNIGHRDISLENILLKNGSVKLMDFGMAVRSCTVSGAPLRYFRGVGKDNYRAPEAYVPTSASVNAIVPSSLPPDRVAMVRTSSDHLCEVRFPPEAAAGSTYMAEVWGYGAKPVDVFASGACFFILSWSVPPWVRAELVDPTFSHVYSRGDLGLASLLHCWGKPLLSEKAMQLLTQMLHPNPCQRPSAKECLMHPWLAQVATDAHF